MLARGRGYMVCDAAPVYYANQVRQDTIENSPMNEDMASTKAGCMNKVITGRKVLSEVLLWRIRCSDDQILLILEYIKYICISYLKTVSLTSYF